MLILTKRLIKGLPPVKRVLAERERLRGEALRLSAERDQVRAEADALRAERDQLRAERAQLLAGHWVPPGHYYSPIPCIEEVRRRHQSIFQDCPRELPSIDLNEQGQLELFREFERYFDDEPFGRPDGDLSRCYEGRKKGGLRYHYENGWYPYGDALVPFCLMRPLRPRRVIELGSGFSPCDILATNNLYFDNRIE